MILGINISFPESRKIENFDARFTSGIIIIYEDLYFLNKRAPRVGLKSIRSSLGKWKNRKFRCQINIWNNNKLLRHLFFKLTGAPGRIGMYTLLFGAILMISKIMLASKKAVPDSGMDDLWIHPRDS